ncbi:hypothetical protein QQ045_020467 [Rhodiola kirilowii]
MVGDTTSEQPFVLDPHSSGLNRYRMVSLMYMFSVDEDNDGELGLPGRVFRQKLPKWTPNVQYYSSREYSRLDHALHYNVQGTLALPVFEPSGQTCVGVVELILTSQKINYAPEVDKVCKALEAVDLKSSNTLDHPKSQICNEGRQKALAEILEILSVTWVPCRHRNVLADGGGLRKSCSSFDGSCMGQVCMSTSDVTFYVVDAHMWGFHDACAEHHLQRGQAAFVVILHSSVKQSIPWYITLVCSGTRAVLMSDMNQQSGFSCPIPANINRDLIWFMETVLPDGEAGLACNIQSSHHMMSDLAGAGDEPCPVEVTYDKRRISQNDNSDFCFISNRSIRSSVNFNLSWTTLLQLPSMTVAGINDGSHLFAIDFSEEFEELLDYPEESYSSVHRTTPLSYYNKTVSIAQSESSNLESIRLSVANVFPNLLDEFGEDKMSQICNFLHSFTSKVAPGTSTMALIEVVRYRTVAFYFDTIRDNESFFTEFKVKLVHAEKNGLNMKLVEYKVGMGDHETCSICLKEFDENAEVVQTSCSHYFHEKCIGFWIMQKHTCPTCPMCRNHFHSATE